MPVLHDNYSYLLIDDAGVTAAIDPAEPRKVRHLSCRSTYHDTHIRGCIVCVRPKNIFVPGTAVTRYQQQQQQ